MKHLWIIFFLFTMYVGTVQAQSNMYEANNNFALYIEKHRDLKVLLVARKFADLVYVTAKDSLGLENNLIRSLVYSSLAVDDSMRTQKYSKDPINIAIEAMGKLGAGNFVYDNSPKLDYVKNQLANAYLYKAVQELKRDSLDKAYACFLNVEKYSHGKIDVRQNLAILAEKTGNTQSAITNYSALLETKQKAKPEYVIKSARLYQGLGNLNAINEVLLKGMNYFPENQDILFYLLNFYTEQQEYEAIVPYLDKAMAFRPNSEALNYLAGFTYESLGKTQLAEQYYKKVIEINPLNYASNFELGLLYLKQYIGDSDDLQKQYIAQEFLLKANEIDPTSVNTLKALAVLFDKAGNIEQLDRVNYQLNQIIIN